MILRRLFDQIRYERARRRFKAAFGRFDAPIQAAKEAHGRSREHCRAKQAALHAALRASNQINGG